MFNRATLAEILVNIGGWASPKHPYCHAQFWSSSKTLYTLKAIQKP